MVFELDETSCMERVVLKRRSALSSARGSNMPFPWSGSACTWRANSRVSSGSMRMPSAIGINSTSSSVRSVRMVFALYPMIASAQNIRTKQASCSRSLIRTQVDLSVT